MPDAQLLDRILSFTSPVLGVAQTAASLAPLPYLPGIFSALDAIVGTIQAGYDTMRGNQESFKGLAEDATGLITILTYWAAKESERTSEVEASVKDLHRTLENIAEFAQQQQGRSRLVRFVLSNEDNQLIQRHRQEIQDASKRFQINSLLSIHSQLSAIVSQLMQSEVKKYEEAEDGIQRRNKQVLEKLESKSDPGASHDSSAREDVPKCLPRTREAVINKIAAWLHDPQNFRPLMWMYGPAGSGKTSIAQSIAELLAELDRLGGSFFWSRSGAGRPTTTKQFAATVCFQLCKVIPGLIDHVASALEHDPGLFNLSMAKQMHQLVVQPLNRVFESDKSLFSTTGDSWLLLVDGLDECAGDAAQKDILNMLVESLSRLLFPLRVLVASRDEHVIRTTLSHHSIVEFLALADSSEYHADADIRTLFESRFKKIREDHAARDSLSNWPTSEQIDILVYRSAGLFIYADVVMKYIEHPSSHPGRRLKEILSMSSTGRDLPFSELDAMYALILKKIPPADIEQVQEIFKLMIYGIEVVDMSLALCDTLLCFEFQGEAAVLLKDLGSVITIPSPSEKNAVPLGFYHASFPDLLQSLPRLQQQNLERLYWDGAAAHAHFARLWINFYTGHQNDVSESLIKIFEPSIYTFQSEFRFKLFIVVSYHYNVRFNPSASMEPCYDAEFYCDAL
ncbi:hypothetical protein HYPSUDRAFT_206073 [Hypholoma sublateritium FD-334 SS-4]|uniref:Nephrocystin 3-like N-terminal domain-containing protein n=1 Tax=Hypholoma sublateritium (strain FD-334 SS-4) TaxID=945553 RepID=A0A0D2M377_HYPSF|nr:hypothetical protein HYPSUDRAFT_206073 [Hypholoma sublateritium FD-334 SS-4]